MSSTVSHGKSAASWKSSTRSGEGPATGMPSTVIDPAAGLLEARDQLQQRGLAAAARAEQADELARLDVEVGRGERLHDAIAAHVGLADATQVEGAPRAHDGPPRGHGWQALLPQDVVQGAEGVELAQIRRRLAEEPELVGMVGHHRHAGRQRIPRVVDVAECGLEHAAPAAPPW